MVVKAATKKRLLELGFPARVAHSLATDRNMAEIKELSVDEIKKIVYPIPMGRARKLEHEVSAPQKAQVIYTLLDYRRRHTPQKRFNQSFGLFNWLERNLIETEEWLKELDTKNSILDQFNEYCNTSFSELRKEYHQQRPKGMSQSAASLRKGSLITLLMGGYLE